MLNKKLNGALSHLLFPWRNVKIGFSIQALRAWHQYLPISVSILYYFLKRYLTSGLSLNHPPSLLSPSYILRDLISSIFSLLSFFLPLLSVFIFNQSLSLSLSALQKNFNGPYIFTKKKKFLNLATSLVPILSPFITKPLKRVVDMLSALPLHSLLSPSAWLLSPALYGKYAFETHWGHLIGKPNAFFSILLIISPQRHY